MCKLVAGFGITDVKPVHIKGKKIKSYAIWVSMLLRCYRDCYLINHPTYTDCYVCDEWKYFSVFKLWFDENYIEGCVLDKDILFQGNKVYSPETCAFVPVAINNAILDRKASRGILPIGVSARSTGSYLAQIGRYGKVYNIGCYTTPQEAHVAYLLEKEKYLVEIAAKYLDEGKISTKVHDALISFKF